MLTSEVRPAEARFELTLAFHCAPALAGIKPADLIALPGEGDETDALLASYSAALAGAGISLRPLCRCRSRCLVLVYRRDRLERQLEQEEVARLLERDGYPLAGGLEEPLSELLLSALACAGIALIMNAVALPLLLKFGAEKARMVSMALFLLVFAGFALLGLAADRGLTLPAPPAWVLTALPGLLAILAVGGFALSYCIAQAIYARKEF